MKMMIPLLVGAMLVACATADTALHSAEDVLLAGRDPAVGCVSDGDCRTSLRLVGWPRSLHRARASVQQLSAGNGGQPFAGDRPLLTTISPNGDGLRERARITFTLTRPATVKLVIARTAARARVVAVRTKRLRAGAHTFFWSPPAGLPARTYITYLAVRDRAGWTIYGRRSGDPRRRQTTPVVRVLGVEAAFAGESYAAGDQARLRVAADTSRVTVQIFRSGPERTPTTRNDELNGVAVTEPRTSDWRARRSRPYTLRLLVGDWPTGVYFAKVTTSAGEVGFAPFLVRPRRLGLHRVAVVLPTYTWQAYNLYDEDGDGWGETWYVHQAQRTVRIGRPQLARGVPMAFRSYDLPFLHWLAWNDRAVDYLAQSDIAGKSGLALRRAYELIIFPGHHEYVTRGEYKAVIGFRNLGGNLMFLSANNFFWRVDRRGNRIRRVAQWRKLGRPEAGLIGSEYVANGRGRVPYQVRDTKTAPWLFAGTGLSEGSRFGHFGTEVDSMAPTSPPGTRVLAEIPNLFGQGRGAQMTYYETPAGAKVFAAGAFTLAGSAGTPHGAVLLDNLWRHLATPEGDAAWNYASAGRRQRLEAAFARESYRPGERATLRLSGDPSLVTLQIFRTGPERRPTRRRDELNGVPASEPVDYRARRAVGFRIGDWPTGMYYARIRTGRRQAFAPFVVRPRTLGEHRVAVVMPTYTWQAYNFRDDDDDGHADTWYADRTRKVARLNRPYLHRGVPLQFRSYDLPFLHWLAWTDRGVDYLAQRDLEGVDSARSLRRRYDLIVFPGHHEYVTTHEYDLVTRYRDLGGNLMFLSANNFFWRVDRHGDELHKVAMWRDLGRPEAALIGVQYVTYGSELRGPYQVRRVPRWLFAGTGLRRGSRFGSFGIEIDRVAPSSPRTIRVLAEIRNGRGRAQAGQMTYYRARSGARVFAAGAFTLAGLATRFQGATMLENLWRHLAPRDAV